MKKQLIYIASCHNAGGIYVYETDGETATQKQFFPVPKPMYLEKKNGLLYAVLRGENDDSLLVSYSLSSDGFIEKELSRVSTLGKVGCHLAVTDEGVFVSNYTSGNVFRTPDLVVTHEGKGPHPKRQTSPHTHAVIPTPDGKYVCVTDLGTDTVWIYDKTLSAVSHVSVPAGYGPRHMVFSACGTKAYCLCELTGHICTFDYKDGDLTLSSVTPSLPSDFKGESIAAAIRIKDSYLYVSHRGHDSIAVLDVAENEPRLLTHVPCGGRNPRDFNIFGDLLTVTNEGSDSVTFFRLENGILYPLPLTLSIPSPLCVI